MVSELMDFEDVNRYLSREHRDRIRYDSRPRGRDCRPAGEDVQAEAGAPRADARRPRDAPTRRAALGSGLGARVDYVGDVSEDTGRASGAAAAGRLVDGPVKTGGGTAGHAHPAPAGSARSGDERAKLRTRYDNHGGNGTASVR